MRLSYIRGSIKLGVIGLVLLILFISMPTNVIADGENIYYIVKPGDTLSAIAKKYNVDTDALAQANAIKDKNYIYPGQKLLITENPPDEGVKTTIDNSTEKTQPQFAEYIATDEIDAPEISIAMVNTKISDVLSVIALNLSEYVFYLGPDEPVTFVLDGVKPKKALELFIKTVEPGGQKLSYIKEGNIFIVGPVNKLKNNFFNQIALTKFKLNYITAENLSTQIAALGLNITNIHLDTATKYLFVQGTPYELAKVSDIISVLDKKEYFPTNSTGQKIFLKQYNLKYINASQLKTIVQNLQIDIDMVVMNVNLFSIWVNGDPASIYDFEDVIKKLDIPQNYDNSDSGGTGNATMNFAIYKVQLKYLVFDEISHILNTLFPDVTILPFKLNTTVAMVYAKTEDFEKFLNLVADLDQLNLANNKKFFFYPLLYVTAEYAADRLSSLGLDKVDVNVLNYPKFGKDLLVVCPDYMQEDIKTLLWNIDVKGTVIKVPVDYSRVEAGQTRLQYRKELLVRLTGLYYSQFFISENISRDDGFHFILYVEGTPDEIKLVRDMIDKIDNP